MTPMDEKIVVALIALSGVIISVILSFIISYYQNKIALKKIHSEFSGKLYSKRLECYLEIFELVSEFVKTIRSKSISYNELNDFYEKYSIKDSKLGLLFSSDMIKSSYNLRKEVIKILASHKEGDTIGKNLLYKHNIGRFLAKIELSMKHELGVFGYENPSTLENSKFTKTYLEIWDSEKDESTNR